MMLPAVAESAEPIVLFGFPFLKEITANIDVDAEILETAVGAVLPHRITQIRSARLAAVVTTKRSHPKPPALVMPAPVMPV